MDKIIINDELNITIKIPIQTTIENEIIFHDTIKEYTESYNRVIEIGWENNIFNSVELHKLSYYDERSNTKLPSQLVCSARVRASETLKSTFTKRKKNKKVSKPISKLCPIRYDDRSCTINFQKNHISIATIKGRIHFDIVIPEYYKQYTDDQNFKICSRDLKYNRKHKKFYIHITLSSKVKFELSNSVIGVDLGVNHPAVTSENKFYGKRSWKEVEQRSFRLKRSLQSKGTKSAKRHLKKLSGKVNRFRNDCDHVISKRLTTKTPEGSTIVLEDLTDIRDRVKARKKTKRAIHSWSFARLKVYLQYKGLKYGKHIDFVDPRYTSQKCSVCGHIERGNRKTQSLFKCKKCGFTLNADLNASRNIRNNYITANHVRFATCNSNGSLSTDLSSRQPC